MENLNVVFWILMIVSAIGVAAFLGTLAVWGNQLVQTHRPVRKERHESIPVYYGHRLAAH